MKMTSISNLKHSVTPFLSKTPQISHIPSLTSSTTRSSHLSGLKSFRNSSKNVKNLKIFSKEAAPQDYYRQISKIPKFSPVLKDRSTENAISKIQKNMKLILC